MIRRSVTQRGKHPRLAAGCVTHHRRGGRAPPPLTRVPAAAGAVLAPGGSAVSQQSQNPPGLGHEPGAGGEHSGLQVLGGGAASRLSAGATSGTARLCHGGRAPPARRAGGVWRGDLWGGRGAEGVTWARKSRVWEKLQKSLARGRIGDYLFIYFPLVSHHLDCCLQESGHEDGHAAVTPCHWVSWERRSRQSGRAQRWGTVCPPPAQGKAEGEAGRAVGLDLPHPRLTPSPPGQPGVCQESVGLMGPPETGWQQLGAPPAPLLCQPWHWGRGRDEAQGRAAPAPTAPRRRYSGKLPHTPLRTTTSSPGMSHPPGWRRPLARGQSPAGSPSLRTLWSSAQAGGQSRGHPALEASPNLLGVPQSSAQGMCLWDAGKSRTR